MKKLLCLFILMCVGISVFALPFTLEFGMSPTEVKGKVKGKISLDSTIIKNDGYYEDLGYLKISSEFQKKQIVIDCTFKLNKLVAFTIVLGYLDAETLKAWAEGLRKQYPTFDVNESDSFNGFSIRLFKKENNDDIIGLDSPLYIWLDREKLTYENPKLIAVLELESQKLKKKWEQEKLAKEASKIDSSSF